LDYFLEILGIIFELKFSPKTQMPLSPELEAYQVNPPVSSSKKSVIEVVSDPLAPNNVYNSEKSSVDSIKMSEYQGKMYSITAQVNFWPIAISQMLSFGLLMKRLSASRGAAE